MSKDKIKGVLAILALLFCWVLIFPLGSFLIDPFLLIMLGSLIVYASVRFLYKRSKYRGFIFFLSLITLAIFYICSVSLYLDLPWIGWMWRMCGAETGRDWMLNSGVFHLNYTTPAVHTHLIAGFLFTLYPLWLYLGIRLGYILFGKNE